MKQKKILFLVQLPPPVHGASLRNQFIVNSKLIRASFNIRVLPINFAKNIQDLETFSIRKVFKMLVFYLKLLSVLINFKPDWVYLTLSPIGFSFIRDALFVSLIKVLGIKIIYHLHGIGIKKKAISWRKPLYQYVFKNTSVICLSKIAAKDIRTVYDNETIIINNGIEDPVKSFGFELRPKGEKKIKKILFLSNLIRSKGLVDLINAIELLCKSRRDFHVVVVGSETKDLSKADISRILNEKKIGMFFSLNSGIYGQKKYREYIKADIFVFPTYYPKENFPCVILEAMACQLPIITTKTGSIPEIIENNRNGLLVEINQPEQIATQLHRILENDNLRYRLGAEARKDFLKFYKQEIFEENIFKCFKNLK